jgi:hypothetical protein
MTRIRIGKQIPPPPQPPAAGARGFGCGIKSTRGAHAIARGAVMGGPVVPVFRSLPCRA